MKTSTSLFLSLLLVGSLAPTASAAEIQIFSNEEHEENGNDLILDFDDTGGDITLQFGQTLAKKLLWSEADETFVFTDDLRVEGQITAGSEARTITTPEGRVNGAHLAEGTVSKESLDFGTGAHQIQASDLPVIDTLDNSNGTQLQETLENLDGAITTNANSAAANTHNITQNTNDITTQESNISQNTADITNQNTRIGNNETAINGNTNANTAQNTTLSGHETRLGNNETAIGNAQADIGSNQGNIANNNATNNTQNITLADHETRIGSNENAVNVLESDLQNLQNITAAQQGDIDGAKADILTNTNNIQNNSNTITQLQTNSATTGGTTENIFILDSDSTGGNVTLQFGNTLNKILTWDDANQRFVMNDDLLVEGNIVLNGTIDGINLSDLQGLVDSHIDGGSGKHDASEIDVETAGNVLQITDLEANLQNIDDAIGNQTYTEENTIQSGESISESLNALDQAIGGSHIASTFIPMNDLAVQIDGSNNKANLYTDSENGNNPHRFYRLKTRKNNLQDLDLLFKIRLPENFVSFDNSDDIRFSYSNTGVDATESKIDIKVQDKDGDIAFSAVNGEGLFSPSWTNFGNEFIEANFDPIAGDYVYVTVRGYTSKNGNPLIGELLLRYTVQ